VTGAPLSIQESSSSSSFMPNWRKRIIGGCRLLSGNRRASGVRALEHRCVPVPTEAQLAALQGSSNMNSTNLTTADLVSNLNSLAGGTLGRRASLLFTCTTSIGTPCAPRVCPVTSFLSVTSTGLLPPPKYVDMPYFASVNLPSSGGQLLRPVYNQSDILSCPPYWPGSSRDMIQDYLEDLIKSWVVIVVTGMLGGLVFSIVWMFFLRYFSGCMAWTTVLLTNVILIVLTIFCGLKGGLIGGGGLAVGVMRMHDCLPIGTIPNHVHRYTALWC